MSIPEGATSIDPGERSQLIPMHITMQEQLNTWEQANIVAGEQWARNKKALLTVSFIMQLHKHMFNRTWQWAGKFRHSDKNIGIDWRLIPEELKKLCDDASYQFKHKSFSDDEIAIRAHHRLVWIHPFPNGNGRHARLFADLLIMQHGRPRFSWGANQDLHAINNVRKQYIAALQAADRGNYNKLIEFART